MSTTPCVSIIVISHNEEMNIGDCLKSLSSIDYPTDCYEIISVDSSIDNTKNIISEYPNVRLISSIYKEFSQKRNIGIKNAKYDFIAFIDADCFVPPDWIEKISKKILNKKVAAVACDVFPPPNASFFGKLIACLGKPAGGAIGFDSYFIKLKHGINVVGSGHTIFKKAVLLQINAFNEDKYLRAGGEDWEISQRIIKSGYILEYETNTFIYHKTRSFIEFLKWSYRHGVAQGLYFRRHENTINVLLSPFSVIWPLFFGLFCLYFNISMVILMVMISFVLFFIVMFTIPAKKSKSMTKLKLLIKRRKKIGISLISICVFVIPLFYFDRLVINLGHLGVLIYKE